MKRPVEVIAHDMYEKESFERFIEGLKLAASAAKEMVPLQPKMGWGKAAEQLYHLIASGRKLAQAKSLTRQALLQHTDEVAYKIGTDVKS